MRACHNSAVDGRFCKEAPASSATCVHQMQRQGVVSLASSGEDPQVQLGRAWGQVWLFSGMAW